MASLSFISASKLVEFLTTLDVKKDMHLRVLSSNRLALGVDPLQPTHVIDLSKERVCPFNAAELAKVVDHHAASSAVEAQQTFLNSSKMTRRSGDYWFEIKGHRVECASLKQLLSETLCILEQKWPGTLEKLSQIKARSRRIVAHDPKYLFDREHLTKRYSERLIPGWWFGTNNSAEQTNAWLERACSCAGLKWGDDLKSSLTIEASIDDL
jgi:hypothetical protein